MSQRDPTFILNSGPATTMMRGNAPMDSDLLSLAEFLGPPNPSIPIDYARQSPISSMNLWQYYQGKNLHLGGEVMRYVSNKKESFLTTLVFPLYQIQEMRWMITTQKANPALATIVPYEGITRMLTTTVESYEGKTERRGVQFKLEDNFFKSPAGAVQFRRGLDHIKDTVKRTLDFMCYRTLDRVGDTYLTYLLQNAPQVKPDLVLDWETRHFGAAHLCDTAETFSGYLVDLIKTTEVYGGTAPDIALIPATFQRIAARAQAVETQYLSLDQRGTPVLMKGPNALMQLGNLKLFATEMIPQDRDYPAIYPAERASVVGQFAVMHCRLSKSDMKKYTTDGLTVFMHSEKEDDYRQFTPVVAYNSCCRWDIPSDNLRREHRDLVDDLNAGNLPAVAAAWRKKGSSQDPMIYLSRRTGMFHVCKYFGDMEPRFLTPTLLSCISDTIANQLARSGMTIEEVDSRLTKLGQLVRDSNNEPATQAYLKKFSEKNSCYNDLTGAAPIDGANLPLVLKRLNSHRGFSFPTEADGEDAVAGLGWVPPFVNVYGMVESLADTYSVKWTDAIKVARDGVEAIGVLEKACAACFPVSQLSDPSYLPMHQRMYVGTDAKTIRKWALFNLCFGNTVPAFIKLFPSSPSDIHTDDETTRQMAYNVTASKLGAITDLMTLSDTPFGRNIAEFQAAAKLVAISKTNLVPLVTPNGCAVATLASNPGLVVDVINLATSVLSDTIVEHNTLIGQEKVELDELQRRSLGRLMARIYLNDLISACNVAESRPGFIWPGYPEIMRTIGTISPGVEKKYAAFDMGMRPANKVQNYQAIIRAEMEDMVKLVMTVLTDKAAVMPNSPPIQPATMAQYMIAYLAPTINAMPFPQRRDYIKSDFSDGNLVGLNGAIRALIPIFSSPNYHLAPEGLGSGLWMQRGVPSAQGFPYVTKDLIDLAAVIALATSRMPALRPEMALVECINYTGATEVVPSALTNNSDTTRAGNRPAASPSAISFETEFTAENKKAYFKLAQQGVLTKDTTLGEIVDIAKKHAAILNTNSYEAMQLYWAPFGCTLAIAQKFSVESGRYGSMPLVFPPDPASDFTLPATPLSVRGGYAVERGSINMAALSEIMDNLRDTSSLAGVTDMEPSSLKFTGPLAIFKPVGHVMAASQIAADAELQKGLIVKAKLLSLHSGTFGLSNARKALCLAFAMSSIGSFKNIKAMMEKDILLPFSFLLARPWITMRTTDIILLKGGLETGATFMGMDDCTIGQDTSVQTMLVNYTFHAQPFCYKPENVIKMKGAIINEVLAGFDLKPITRDDETPLNPVLHQRGSVICMLGGYYDARLGQPNDPDAEVEGLGHIVSITGDYRQIPMDKALASQFQVFGPTAYYSKVFPETLRQAQQDIGTTNTAPLAGYQVNTICFLGEHYYLDPAVGTFSAFVHNTGHFSKTATMPGTAAVRKGKPLCYPLTYSPRVGLTVV